VAWVSQVGHVVVHGRGHDAFTGQARIQRLGLLVEKRGDESESDPAVLVTLLGGGER